MLQRICNGPGGEIRARPVANRGVAFWVGGRAGCIDNSDDAYIRFERLCVPFEAQKSVTEQEYVPGGRGNVRAGQNQLPDGFYFLETTIGVPRVA